MKKAFFSLLSFVVLINISFAQNHDYKSFRVDAGFLYACPRADTYDGGLGYYLHPKYSVSDQILLGLKHEATVMDEGAFSSDNPTIVSLLGTVNYYFKSQSFRPFIGAGMGLYHLGCIKNNVDADRDKAYIELEQDLGNKFGFAPEVGFSYGHFDMSFQYNMILGVDSKFESKNYFAIKAGFHFGGGKK